MFSENYKNARYEMVKYQIKDRDISNPLVLAAMEKVERHLFVPDEMKPIAYTDHPLPIGWGQTISQPYIVALMTDALVSKGLPDRPPADGKLGMKVLEIGTGSGYQAAVFAEIAAEVYTVEVVEKLAVRAKNTLDEAGYKNIYVKCGDGHLGWPEKAPFDRIIITCAPEVIPLTLLEQLDPGGGMMVVPVGANHATQSLVLVNRNGDKFEKTFMTYVLFVPMVKK